MIELKNIKSPQDIKSLSINDLTNLSEDIRKFILEKVSKNGGHLSSNLGVVELTVALHYVFNSPFDKIIFDVGHQIYTHKILTGRSEGFDNLRKLNGLSGFPKYSESEHDVFEAGHSSTSISALCGFIEAKRLGSEMGEVIAVIGDGSFQNGLALSGLNFLSSLPKNQKAIIIINDNDMSISKNVGGLANSFNRMRVNRSYNAFKNRVPEGIKFILHPFKKSIWRMVYKNNSMFNELGFKYIGPIDGHNIKELVKYLEFAKKHPKTVVLHVKTIKGKGYKPAEEDKIGFYHGLGSFDLETGKLLKQNPKDVESFSAVVSKSLNNILDKHPNVNIITPAMGYGVGFENIDSKFHNRIIDVGIQEENAVVMASAMSRTGIIPIISTYSTFLQRAYDEINHDVARSNSHVVFLTDRAGLVPNDGNTHQGVFDVSMLLSIPNMIITSPSSKTEVDDLLELSVQSKKPFLIRYPKGSLNVLDETERVERIGKWSVVNEYENADTVVITYGIYVNEFKEKLQGLNIGLINALFIKPMDYELINSLKGKKIVVFEDAMRNASLGSEMILYSYKCKLNLDIIHYAIDEFVDSGDIQELKDKYNLSVSKVIEEIKK